MENKILLIELKNEKQTHEIFARQNPSDLNELAKVIRKEYPHDILVMFDPKEYWEKVENIIYQETIEYRTRENKDITLEQQTAMKILDQYVALKILEDLSKKNTPLNMFFDEARLSIFRRGDWAAYEMFKDKMPNSGDVKEILRLDEKAPTRIHFIVNGVPSSRLCDTLSTYLDNSTSFATRIYLSPNGFYTTTAKKEGNLVWLWEAYDYMSFDKEKEGYQPKPYRSKIKKEGQKKN